MLRHIDKNEIKRSICGEDAHRECNKLVTCRNCGEDHRFTARNCPVLLRNIIIIIFEKIELNVTNNGTFGYF